MNVTERVEMETVLLRLSTKVQLLQTKCLCNIVPRRLRTRAASNLTQINTPQGTRKFYVSFDFHQDNSNLRENPHKIVNDLMNENEY
jgi:hypothetical protein